jgi:cardiolipin synthase A/B
MSSPTLDRHSPSRRPPQPVKRMPRNKRILRAILLVAGTLLLALLVLNLSLGNKQVDRPIPRVYATRDAAFAGSMSGSLGRRLVGGNSVQELLNGNQAFSAMLAAIQAARSTITLETYIYWSGETGRRFAVALAERAAAGVQVRVLLDWIGGDLDPGMLQLMTDAGVRISRYNPPRWYNLQRLNNRTHRKLLIVDGEVGFTGGLGIADAWKGDATEPGQWRDTHFVARGPVVSQLQSAFTDNWLQSTGEVLHGAEYFPVQTPRGTSTAHVFTSSPGGGAESVQLMYLLSIAAATSTIDLSAAYFVPDEVAIDALVAAMQRGVRVRIIVPGPFMDVPPVRWASRHRWQRILEAGGAIHEYQQRMYHCKMLIVDGLWVSVGSANFDNRSLAINDEANMNVYDAEFAARQSQVFEQDLKRSELVTLQAWRARPVTVKVLDAAASLFGSQL